MELNGPWLPHSYVSLPKGFQGQKLLLLVNHREHLMSSFIVSVIKSIKPASSHRETTIPSPF
jgi:hypothetical protein